MLRPIVSLGLWLSLVVPVGAFSLGQTAQEVRNRYGAPTRLERNTWIYERPVGRVVLLMGVDQRIEGLLQFDPGLGRDYPQVGQFLASQTPALSFTDAKKTHSIELFQQLSPRGYEAWLFKKQTRNLWVFGDAQAVPTRRDEAREILAEYAKRVLNDPKHQPKLIPVLPVP